MSGTPTEKPTPKRLQDARRRGEIATSRELTSAAALVAGLIAIALTGPSVVAKLAAHLRGMLAAAPRGDLAPDAALLMATQQLAGSALAPLAGAAIAACACGALQTRALFAPKAVAVRWSRVSPVAGMRRLFSTSQLAVGALGICKVVAIALLAWTQRDELGRASAALAQGCSPAALVPAVPAAIGPLAFRLCGLLAVFGVGDLLLARRRHERSLRMTPDEIRREQKEQDGDPQHKAERRRAHRSIASAAPAARATCVVVNPTHIAVALHHEPGSDDAPVVLAKGSGEQARRIRVDALRAAVPIVKDVALARALFRLAEVGDEIPEELYHAAAAVLIHVHGLSQEDRP
ncbi:MAG TPA: EscU/YscU/HrcU family type III secretion system export apparatus switch protein [Anaeromyxobacteraceae bacterium]|nr:EscU/YscU/HrcU family type III secretion system export apparatus switch protein [Anaeromyxobacteraceae bacterium]